MFTAKIKNIFFFLVVFFFLPILSSAETYNVSFSYDTAQGYIVGEQFQSVSYGESTSPVYAYPFEHYQFKEFIYDNIHISDNPIIISNIDHDITVTAVFEPKIYTLMFVASDGGSISGDTIQYISYNEDSKEVTAIPDEGYIFKGWYDLDTAELLSMATTFSVSNIQKDKSIIALFAEGEPYKVTFIPPASGGTVSGDIIQYVSPGSSTSSVTAIPDTGYIFAGWTGSIVSMDNPLIITDVSNNLTIQANFIRDENYFLITLKSFPEDAVTFSENTIAVKKGEPVTISLPSLKPDFSFQYWQINTEDNTINSQSFSFTPEQDSTVTAICTNINQFCNLRFIRIKQTDFRQKRDSILMVFQLDDFIPKQDIMQFSFNTNAYSYTPDDFKIKNGESFYGTWKNPRGFYKYGQFIVRLVKQSFSAPITSFSHPFLFNINKLQARQIIDNPDRFLIKLAGQKSGYSIKITYNKRHSYCFSFNVSGNINSISSLTFGDKTFYSAENGRIIRNIWRYKERSFQSIINNPAAYKTVLITLTDNSELNIELKRRIIFSWRKNRRNNQ